MFSLPMKSISQTVGFLSASNYNGCVKIFLPNLHITDLNSVGKTSSRHTGLPLRLDGRFIFIFLLFWLGFGEFLCCNSYQVADPFFVFKLIFY